MGNANRLIQNYLLTYLTSAISAITSDIMRISLSPHKLPLAEKACVVIE